MKLKKIASLALAGIMAISMLAGCKGKEDSKDDTASGVNAAAVIAALDKEDIDVTFTANATLQAVADKAAGYVTDGVQTDVTLSLLNTINSKVVTESTQQYLPKVDTATDDMKEQSATFVVKSTLVGASDDATVKDLVSEMKKIDVARDAIKLTALPEKSQEYTDNNTEEKYQFTFKYTADVAVTSSTNSNGQATYYVVFTLNRVPTRVAVD